MALQLPPAVQGFFSRILGRNSATTPQSPPQTTGLFPIMVGGPAIYPDANTENYVRLGFSGNGSVYTIISRVARKFGSIPRYVYKITDKTAERQMKSLIKQRGHQYKLMMLRDLQKKAYDEQVVENALSELLARPNDKQGQDAFYELAMVYYLSTGNAIVWLNRGDTTDANGKPLPDDVIDKMPPLEMYVLPTQCMQIIPDPADVWGYIGWIFRVAGLEFKIRKNDIIHWRMPNPNFDPVTREHMWGMSPLRPGNKWVTEDDSATDASVAMQQNDGAKGVLFNKQMGNMSPEQKSKIDQLVNRKINNRSLKGAVAAMEGDWDYRAMGQTGQEMELVDVRDKGFIRLCNLLGVPPALFLTETTFNNQEQAEKAFVNNLVTPLAASFRDEMNRVLLPAFGLDKSYTHDIDISQLPELQTEMSQMVTQLAAAWWYTPNQKLKAMGEDEDPDPNMDKRWIPNNLITMDDAAMTDTLDSFTNDPGTNQNSGGGQGAIPSQGGSGKGN